MTKKKLKPLQAWIIELRGAERWLTTKYPYFLAFNTLKFDTIQGAVAYARTHNLSPKDYNLTLMEFTNKIIERRDYSFDE